MTELENINSELKQKLCDVECQLQAKLADEQVQKKFAAVQEESICNLENLCAENKRQMACVEAKYTTQLAIAAKLIAHLEEKIAKSVKKATAAETMLHEQRRRNSALRDNLLKLGESQYRLKGNLETSQQDNKRLDAVVTYFDTCVDDWRL